MADNPSEAPLPEEQRTDDDKIVSNTDALKTDGDKAEEEIAKESQYESDEFETESESEVAKTDEEKCNEKSAGNGDSEIKTDDEKNKTEPNKNGDADVLTDDEKLGNDINEGKQQGDTKDRSNAEEGNGDTTLANTETDTTTEMSETTDNTKGERVEEAEAANQEAGKTEQEQGDVTAVEESDGYAELTNQDFSKAEADNVETNQDQESPDKEAGNETQEVDTKDEENKESEEKLEDTDAGTDAGPVDAGPPIAKEDLQSKIKENDELALKLESSLSNQEAERDAYRKLTEENAKLQKHHDDMKEKLEEIEGSHVVLVAEVETLRKVNNDQRETITRLESEIKLLKETQGGDENVKDMQEKLIRMANEQEEKDRRIHSLEGELDATREKLKDAESRAARGGNNTAQNSKTCIIM